MKVAPLALLAILAGSPFAIVAFDAMGVGEDFQVDAPEWAPGATWEWDVTGRGRAVGEGFGIVRFESDTLQVDATRRAEVLNTTLESDGDPIALVLEAFRIDQVREGDAVVYEGDTDEAVPSDAAGFAEEFFCITPCGTFLATYRDGNPHFGTHAFHSFGTEEMRLVDFPLTRGKTWDVISVEEDGVLFEIEAKAVDHEYVNLPGRTPMPAIRIEATLTEASKDAIEQVVRDEAAKEDLTVDLDMGLTVTYWYAPDVQNIVKLDLDGFVTGRGVGYGAAASGRVDFHLDQLLKQVSLTPTRERSVEEAHALAGATRDSDGTAPRTSPRDLDFQVGASILSLDADQGQPARFGLVTDDRQADADEQSLDRFDPAPEESRIVWTHRTPTATSAGAEGPEATFTFEEPGVHVVRAQVFDLQGRLMGTDQVLVEAYTLRTFEIGAGSPVGTPLKAYHEVGTVTFADGASSATLSLATDGAARGILTVGAGETDKEQKEQVDLVAGSLLVEVQDLSGGLRTLTWSDETRVGPLTGTLEVRYARALTGTLG